MVDGGNSLIIKTDSITKRLSHFAKIVTGLLVILYRQMRNKKTGITSCWILKDANGHIVRYETKGCFVIQFAEILYRFIYSAASTAATSDFTATDGTEDRLYASWTSAAVTTVLACSSPAGNTTYGIVVGTGDTAVVYTNHDIETKIAHGTGAGQLSYGAHSPLSVSYDSELLSFGITRTITNSSGSTITVKEVAIICAHVNGYNTAYFLLDRHVFETSVPMVDGSVWTFTWRIDAEAA
jgi:hypothetical protein